MCGRITQKSNPKVLGLKIATLVEPLSEAPPRYNGAPGQEHWVIRQHPETGERPLDRLRWGLIPDWIKEPSPKLKPINATAERVASAPMFRAAYAKRRCLVPIDSFFEWKAIRTHAAQAALRDRHEERRAVRPGRHLGELAAPRDRRYGAHVLRHHPPPTS